MPLTPKFTPISPFSPPELQANDSNRLWTSLLAISNLTIPQPNSRSPVSTPVPPPACPILVNNSSSHPAVQTKDFDSSSLLFFLSSHLIHQKIFPAISSKYLESGKSLVQPTIISWLDYCILFPCFYLALFYWFSKQQPEWFFLLLKTFRKLPIKI